MIVKLYYSPGACSLAAHIALREADRRFDLERVDLASHRTASGKSLYDITPKGYVPVLELDEAGAQTLTEVQVILQYVADLDPGKQLAPPARTVARYQLQEWLAFLSSELHAQLGALAHDENRAVHDRRRGKIAERLSYLQLELEDRPFLLGETYSVADTYLFAMLQWCDSLRLDLQIWPSLDAYEQRIAGRPAVRAAMSAEGLRGRSQADVARIRRSA